MPKLKRVLNIKVTNTRQTVELMRALSELDADIIAESRPGTIKIRIYGSKGEIRNIERRILALTSAKSQPS